MPLASRVMQYLNRQGVPYQQIHHDRAGNIDAALRAAEVLPDCVAVAEILVDAKGVVMAITEFGTQMNLEALNGAIRRNLQRLTGRQADRLFRDCEPGSHPPIASAYGVHAVCDERLFAKEQIYIQSGCHNTLLRLDRESFQRVMSSAIKLKQGCCEAQAMNPLSSDTPESPDVGEANAERVAERLKRLYKLPPMPTVATRILQATSDPDATAGELAAIIEQDPSLAAQIMRQARSALYGYRGKLESVKDAVMRVLGFERVSQLALSISASKAFDLPNEGPLGIVCFWRHALHVSLLAQRLAFHVPDERINPSLAYLTGLLHNFGILLLGHLFRPEYTMLNKLAEADPMTELAVLEKQVLGMGGAKELVGLGHGMLGSILLEHWRLPKEVSMTAAGHQVKDYHGPYEDYVLLIQLSNCLLKELELGDDQVPDDPVYYAKRLDIQPEIVFEVFEQLKQSSDSLNQLASQMG
ncbi:HDOD domain-containing protein [Hahella sp. KA22]|nr:HDOD domain-containing protein [Hahella sp. KA22]QAY57043.1 HDOD domain-containing protein [Hahella sp. KA22]